MRAVILLVLALAAASSVLAKESDPFGVDDLFDGMDSTSELEESTELQGMQSLLQDAISCNVGPRIEAGSPEFDLALKVWGTRGCPVKKHFKGKKTAFKKWLGSKSTTGYDAKKAFECKQLVSEILGKNPFPAEKESSDKKMSGCPFKNLKKGEKCWSAALRYKGRGGSSKKRNGLWQMDKVSTRTNMKWGGDAVAIKCPENAKYNADLNKCVCKKGAKCSGKRVATPQKVCRKMGQLASKAGLKKVKKAVKHLKSCWNQLHGLQAAHGVKALSDKSTTHVVSRSSSAVESMEDKRKEIASHLGDLYACFSNVRKQMQMA